MSVWRRSAVVPSLQSRRQYRDWTQIFTCCHDGPLINSRRDRGQLSSFNMRSNSLATILFLVYVSAALGTAHDTVPRYTFPIVSPIIRRCVWI